MSEPRTPLALVVRGAAVATGLGIAGLAIGASIDRTALFFAYLTAFAWLASIVVGALVFLMVCHAMRAVWPVAVRRLTESIAAVTVALPILFVPILFGMRRLYPWCEPGAIADERARRLVEHKAPYLNAPFFLVRAAIYFAIWIACATLLRRWSFRQVQGASADDGRKSYVLSGAALPAVGLALTFASFDWTMSLTPIWQSTMYPVYWFGGGFLGALAVLTLFAASAERAGLLPLRGSHFYALGRLLLAFTIFWAYVAFFQLMLIWIANKPEEGVFFAVRWHGPWQGVSVALGLTKFVIPFFVLLSYRIKWRPDLLSIVAGWLLVAHWVDMHWLVVPAARPMGPAYRWLDFAALLAVGGSAIVFGAWRQRGHPLMPLNDPALSEALRYESS